MIDVAKDDRVRIISVWAVDPASAQWWANGPAGRCSVGVLEGTAQELGFTVYIVRTDDGARVVAGEVQPQPSAQEEK